MWHTAAVELTADPVVRPEPHFRAMERGVRNAAKIGPPQPSFSTTSTPSFFPSLLSRAILSVFLSVFF